MMAIQIIHTLPGDENFHLFEQLPVQLYTSDSIRNKQSDTISSEYLHSAYIIIEDAIVKGRAALYNNPFLNYKTLKAACIGNYECVEDEKNFK